MATFLYRNSSTYDNANSTASISLAVPTGMTSGDIMFCLRSHGSANGSATTWSSGWTQLVKSDDGASHWWELYYCVYNGTQTGVTIACPASGVRCKITIVAYYGDAYYSANPILEVSNVKYAVSNVFLRAGSVTTTEANSAILHVGGVFSGTVRTFTKPSGLTNAWVEDYDFGTTGADFDHNFNSIVWSGLGATDVQQSTISFSFSTGKHAFMVALNKPPAPPPVRQRIRITHQ